MPSNLKAYRVFIASPGGLQAERHAFRDTLNEYNATDAMERDAIFLPIGWEDTLGGVGRPQEFINDDIRRCDYLFLVFHDRWGSSSSSDSSRFTSATEEEYYLALECLHSTDFHMRQVVVLFKGVDARQLSDPGQQLQKVLAFRKKLEEEKKQLFHQFDTTDALKSQIRKYIAQWLRHSEGGNDEKPATPQSPIEPTTPADFISDQPSTTREVSERVQQAETLANEGRATDAESILAEAFVLGQDLPAMINYSQLLRDSGRVDQAEAALSKALDLARQRQDKLMETAALVNLAYINLYRAHFKQSEEFYTLALQLQESYLGYQHPDLADTLNGLAVLCSRLGRFEEAEQFFNRVIIIQRDQLGDDHPTYGNTLNNLALLYGREGKYSDAEPLYLKAFHILEKALGPLDPKVANTLNNLGLLYISEGRYSDAEVCLKEALNIRETNTGRQDLDVAQNLANIAMLYRLQAKYNEAEPLYKEALAIEETILGPDHPDVANTMNNLGVLYISTGKYSLAMPLIWSALEIRQRYFGPTHPLVANSMGNLATLYLEQGKFEDAEKAFEASIAIEDIALGEGHPDRANTLRNFAQLLRSTNRVEQALRLEAKAAQIKSRASVTTTDSASKTQSSP